MATPSTPSPQPRADAREQVPDEYALQTRLVLATEGAARQVLDAIDTPPEPTPELRRLLRA